jgi:hypothetical protein
MLLWRMRKITQYFLVLAFTFSTVGGCAIYNQTQPVSPLFLDGATLDSTVDRVPFQHAWSSSNSGGGISSIYVKPVRVDLLSPDSWTESTSLGITSAEDYNKAAQSLAVYFDERLREELRHVYERNKRLRIVDAISQDSVILEIALTEIVLSRPVSHAVGMAAPVPGLGMALSAMHEPHVAFAARFMAPDGATLFGTVADRRFPPIRVLDLNKLTLTSSIREIISQWARELAEAIEFERLAIVERSSRFSLLPW